MNFARDAVQTGNVVWKKTSMQPVKHIEALLWISCALEASCYHGFESFSLDWVPATFQKGSCVCSLSGQSVEGGTLCFKVKRGASGLAGHSRGGVLRVRETRRCGLTFGLGTLKLSWTTSQTSLCQDRSVDFFFLNGGLTEKEKKKCKYRAAVFRCCL